MLPQGRIAMLFTDIEGSTRMVHDLGPVYADVLRDQRRLIRSAIAEFHGHEMGTEGDSFFVVFSTVEEALRTAVTAQRALAAHRWPGGGQVRVRMGLHAGEPARHEEGYVGVDLNRAARVASTAHGGQIVVSGEFHHEAVSVAIRGLSFRDLGLHRLKDLPAPEHLYQVLVPDLPDITTAVKSLGAPSNLPGERNPLIGRDELVANLVDLLHEGERLVTLIGPGGVGKTSVGVADRAGGLQRLHRRHLLRGLGARNHRRRGVGQRSSAPSRARRLRSHRRRPRSASSATGASSSCSTTSSSCAPPQPWR